MFFPRNLFACFFPPEISLQDIFFLKSPITPSKVKWSAPKIHQTFGQLTDSDLSIISKGFWNNRGQNSLGERGGIRFYLPLPGKFVLTYGDVITKFSRIDSLPNFITHGAPLRARRRRYQYTSCCPWTKCTWYFHSFPIHLLFSFFPVFLFRAPDNSIFVRFPRDGSSFLDPTVVCFL